MTTEEDLEQPPPVQFVRIADSLRAAMASPKQSITLDQGQSVVLVADGVAVKVANNKFHSLKATTFVLVKFAARVNADKALHDGEPEEQQAQQVEPALVGTAITCNGKTLALVSAIDSKSKRLTIDLADGVQVQDNFT